MNTLRLKQMSFYLIQQLFLSASREALQAIFLHLLGKSKHGFVPFYGRRSRSLDVRGVGNVSQECHFDYELLVAFQNSDREYVSIGRITTPTDRGSELLGLLGFQALKKNRAVLDIKTNKAYFFGPGTRNLIQAMPLGIDCFRG